MDKREFLSIMEYLYTAYRQEADTKEISVYYDALSIYPPDSLMKACREWIQDSVFFPRVAVIIRLIRDQEISLILVMKELRKVLALDKWSSKDIHPASKQIMDELGGRFSLKQMTEKEFEKKIKYHYGYVVSEQIMGIGHDQKKQVGTRSSTTSSLGEIINDIQP